MNPVIKLPPVRNDLRLIAQHIPHNSRVLDVGCGNGQLLEWLFQSKNCTGVGVERDASEVIQAMQRGIPVLDMDIDAELGQLEADSFDVVILSRTLQAVLRPDLTLAALGQLAPTIILTMPNFGYYQNRWRLLTGHMPRSKDLPYTWYETPNLHHTTMVDLEPLFDQVGLQISHRIPLSEQGRRLRGGKFWPNLRAGAVLYVLKRI